MEKVLLVTDDGIRLEINLNDLPDGGVGFEIHISTARAHKVSLGDVVRSGFIALGINGF